MRSQIQRRERGAKQIRLQVRYLAFCFLTAAQNTGKSTEIKDEVGKIHAFLNGKAGFCLDFTDGGCEEGGDRQETKRRKTASEKVGVKIEGSETFNIKAEGTSDQSISQLLHEFITSVSPENKVCTHSALLLPQQFTMLTELRGAQFVSVSKRDISSTKTSQLPATFHNNQSPKLSHRLSKIQRQQKVPPKQV